jgi:hypothetical protein
MVLSSELTGLKSTLALTTHGRDLQYNQILKELEKKMKVVDQLESSFEAASNSKKLNSKKSVRL